jgi:hypothetical protein
LLDATGETTITSTETISAGAWSFVLVKHYATLDKVEIKINETSEETAYALGLNATAAPFRIGRGSVEGGGHFDGDISKVFMFKGITTDVEDTWLNNGRVGGEFGVAGTGARLTVANGLVSTWNCNEADGTSAIYDSTGTNDLTLTTSNLLSNPGFETISGNTGRQWYVNHKNTLNIADNAALSTGDVDFCVATWFYADSLQDQTILAKWGSDEEYMIIYSASASRFQFFVRNAADSSTTILSADNLGAPSTGTWYLIVAWHDATGNTINIKVNNGTTDSAAHTTGVNDAAMDFCLGGRSNGAEYTRGRIGPTAFWKRADLDAAEHTWLYNSGQARLHHELGQADDGSDLLTNLQAYWDMNSTGTAGETDRQGANNLTITSYEILTNGDFASDITGWTNDATFTWDTTFAWSAGAMNLAQSGDSVPTWSSANQVVGVREGYSYTYGADLTLNSGSGQFRLNLNASPVGSGLVTLLTATGSGTISGTAVATGTDSTAYFDLHSQNNAASDWDVDNCTLKCNSLLAVSDADVFSDWVESTTGLSTCNIDTADVQAGNVAGRQDIDPSDSYAWFYQDVLKDGNYYTTTVQAKATAICTGSVLTGSGTAGDLSLTTSYQELSVATQLCTTDTKLYIGRKSGASAAGESLYFDTVSTVAATVPATTGPRYVEERYSR